MERSKKVTELVTVSLANSVAAYVAYAVKPVYNEHVGSGHKDTQGAHHI